MGATRPHRKVASSTAWHIAKPMLLWWLALVAAKPLLSFRWPPFEWSGGLVRFLRTIIDDTGFVLPFLVFAGAVALRNTCGFSGRVLRATAVLGVATSAVSYALAAWVAPTIHDRELALSGPEAADVRRFGPRTPAGVLRNLRFVEANPPSQYSLRVAEPERFPPNVLRWELHLSATVALFAVINALLGLLAADLTVDLRRGNRRNARLAIGLMSGIAFLGIVLLTEPTGLFLLSGELRSGILAAWVPLLLPTAGCLLLVYLVRSRRYG